MHLRHKPCYTKDRVIYLKKGLIRKILAVILIIALVTGLENYAGIADTTVKAADAFGACDGIVGQLNRLKTIKNKRNIVVFERDL